MISFRPTTLLLTAATLLSLTTGATAQNHNASPVKATATAPGRKPMEPVVAESLSGLDLIPNRKTGVFAVRINHRLTQPATLHLIDVNTSRYLKTEMLQPSNAATRAIQVGHLALGEYKMEVVLPDTVYWKTVRVSR
ncbi:MAG: hypothetical protein H7330_05700 [Hymenobacteraceae bacterium]|nr:hypothetical protein [Hymenobacteraceae bacterium]